MSLSLPFTLQPWLIAALLVRYEGMYVIPLNDDLQALTDSIGEIDKGNAPLT